MFDNRKHTVENRILSISQPYVRMEKLSWYAYNECESLIPITESYKARNGFYSERILADKIYRNRKNLNYCKENGISITGPALGRPKKNKTRAERKQEYVDTCKRNKVEEKVWNW